MTFKYERQIHRGRYQSLSRYRDSRVITDVNDKLKFLESYQFKDIPKSSEDYYHEVKPEEELRLDLISFRFYQTPLLWWIIAEANNLSNPLVSPEVGDILRIPAITSLYGNGGILL